MANSPQALKRARQNEKRRVHNISQKSETRTAMKKVLKAIQDKNVDGAKEAFKTATTLLDRLAGRRIIPANTAARLKSRMNKKIKAIA